MALPFPGTIPKPAVSFFGLSREFTVLRQGAEHRWLREYGHKEVKYTLKYLADAYRKFWTGQGQQPRCKARQRTTDGFTIPGHVAVSDTHLRMPRIGWLRVQGSNLYTDCLQARIRKEGTATQPKWYVSVVYAVPVTQVRPGAAPTGALGLDRNVGQATASDGTVHRMTDTARLDARLKRHQRQGSCRSRRIAGQLTKLHRKCQRIRAHDIHHISRRLANAAHTVVLENLSTQGMTRSAQGTGEQPGKHVTAKAGLNRSILASGWGPLAQKLTYKCNPVIHVKPHYTSQTCSRCGCVDPQHRPAQSRCCCIDCQCQLHADHNAALNMLGRAALPVAQGTGAAARRGAFSSGTPTTRERESCTVAQAHDH